MAIIGSILRFSHRLWVLTLPAYHPERYYMRGPGPACARRALMTVGGAH